MNSSNVYAFDPTDSRDPAITEADEADLDAANGGILPILGAIAIGVASHAAYDGLKWGYRRLFH